MATAISLPTHVHRVNPSLAGRDAWYVPGAVGVGDVLQVDLEALIALVGGTADVPSRNSAQRFGVQRVARGATLAHEGAAAQSLYVVQAGSFKSVKTAEDGYEHVIGFAWRRDLIGYDALYRDHHAFSAVALEDSRVVVLPLATLRTLRLQSPALDSALQSLVARQLTHAGEIAEVMSAVAADVRLARFLVQLSARMAERGESPRRLLLRMNRRDIANHLGLAHETISRSFRMLSEAGWLRVDNRDVQILDPDGLKRAARSTRGGIDDGAREALHCALA
jgi:CRP/FNR family transcriptional regulator, anaerobic regulatory protein